MKTYRATTEIQAPPQTIWEILTHGPGYPDWDPGMLRVEGQLAPGAKVKFITKLSPDQAFPVTVTGFEPGRQMVLTGGMPFGLFKSERTHSLAAGTNGQTIFTTEETFSGLLYPLFGKRIPDLTENFEAFAAGLKRKAESMV